MPIPTPHDAGIMGIISAAVTPVVLISAVAILFSGLTAKHSHLADQIRQLTLEYRNGVTPVQRRRTIRKQLRLFERRITALWLANSCLSLSILSFVCTILGVLYAQRAERIGTAVIGTLVAGLSFLVLAIVLETTEIALGRWSMTGETADIDFAPEDDIVPEEKPVKEN